VSDPQVTPGRAARRARPPGVWILAGLVALVVVAVAIVALAGGDGSDPASITRSPAADGGPAEPTRLALVLQGASEPLVAFVGSGGDPDPAALVLPPALSMVVPGAGELEVRETAALPLEEMQLGLSNGVGAWAAQAARIDVAELADVQGDRTLGVNLAAPATLGGAEVGPGEVDLTALQVRELLTTDAEDTHLRWQAVLTALLAEPERFPRPIQATDPEAVGTILQGARGASVTMAPIETIAGTLQVPLQPRFDRLVGELFGTPVPVPVEVRNGSGEPGAGELVGAAIVPIGYRIILSGNAETFDVRRTEIIANGVDHQPEAQAIRDAIGTGTVRVSQVPSGIADVTVITGSDLR
jgi:hypothetical protein